MSIRSSLIMFVTVLILFSTSCGSKEAEYDFPISEQAMKEVLAKQNSDWFIKDVNAVSEAQSIITLTKGDTISFGIDSQMRDNKKILSMVCFLPGDLTKSDYDDFYRNELPEIFDLSGTFYGNKKETDKELKELLEYYLTSESNYEKSVYWAGRAGDDHIKAEIKPMLDQNQNQIVSLLIMPDESYEDYLISLNEGWKKFAEAENIIIHNSTVAEMKEEAPPIADGDIYLKQLVIHGRLEKIKEIEAVPESLANTKSSFLKPNRDKYLSAELVDSTGRINVFLQMTSLSADELYIERDHNITMVFYNGQPIYVVRFSVLNI
ncbi:MAG: hypothetical protein AAGU76_18625 [Sedimentibacter sp.]|uniref:hypothetical protein n=1 Tax=Sedimentibacter sp. TaxID=1960295 RepID=UPI003158F676